MENVNKKQAENFYLKKSNMKKTKTILLSALALLFASSCENGKINNFAGDTIVKIISTNDGKFCRYYTSGSWPKRGGLQPIEFVDSCGKYKVGDLVCVTKK